MEAEANARLIAAAPDLLAALNGVLEHYANRYHDLTDGEHGDIEPFQAVKRARAAIAKAGGSND